MDTNYNLASLVSKVKARLKDADYDEADIKQFINDAYFEIVGEDRYTFLERSYKSTTVKGGSLLLPCDFQTLIHITANNGDGKQSLSYLPPDEYLSLDEGDGRKNYCYTIYGDKLLIELPNMEDIEGDPFYTINLYYLAKPMELVEDDDAPRFPREYAEILVLSALYRAEQLRDNFDYAQIYDNKAQDLILNMKARYCPRQMDNGNRSRLPIRIQVR